MIATEIPLSDVLAFRIPRAQLVTGSYANGYEGVRNPIRFGNLAPWRIRFAGRPGIPRSAFPDRLMAGQHSLEVLIVVRIHVREQV